MYSKLCTLAEVTQDLDAKIAAIDKKLKDYEDKNTKVWKE